MLFELKDKSASGHTTINPDEIIGTSLSSTSTRDYPVCLELTDGRGVWISLADWNRIKPFVVASLGDVQCEFKYLDDPSAAALGSWVSEGWDIVPELSAVTVIADDTGDWKVFRTERSVTLRREKAIEAPQSDTSPASSPMFQSDPVPQAALDAINKTGDQWDAKQQARFTADQTERKQRQHLSTLWAAKNEAYDAYITADDRDYEALDRYRLALEAYADSACGYIAMNGKPLSIPLDSETES